MRWTEQHSYRLIVWSLVGLLAMPLLATLLYSLSSRWGATLLPDGLREIMNGAESIDVDHYFPGLGSARETG